MGTAITLAAVLIVLGCVMFAVIYHRSGSEWWASHIGRALMIFDGCLFAVLAYVTERRLATGSPDPGRGADVAELGIFLVVGAAEWYLVYAFRATLTTWRRRRMMTISRGATTMSDTTQPDTAAQAPAGEESNHQPAADATAESTETATHELATPAAVQAHETLAQHARDFLATVQQDVQGAANGIAAHLRDWLNAVGL